MISHYISFDHNYVAHEVISNMGQLGLEIRSLNICDIEKINKMSVRDGSLVVLVNVANTCHF